MHAWEAIQKAVEYMEDNLQREMTIEELAKTVSLSPFYFQRLFRRLVNKPVMEYIKLRRLSKAAQMLQSEEKRILDIALDCGFGDHTSFTRSFKQAYGLSPKEYRDNPVILNHFLRPDLLLHYTLVDENVPLITEEIVLEIGRQSLKHTREFIGLTKQIPIPGQIPPGETTGVAMPGKVWEELYERKEELEEFAAGNVELGASFFGEAEGCFSYFAGIETSARKKREHFSNWQLQKGDYIVCRIEAESREKLVEETLDRGLGYLLNTWLPGHNYEIEPFSAEIYGKEEEDVYRLEIWTALRSDNP